MIYLATPMNEWSHLPWLIRAEPHANPHRPVTAVYNRWVGGRLLLNLGWGEVALKFGGVFVYVNDRLGFIESTIKLLSDSSLDWFQTESVATIFIFIELELIEGIVHVYIPSLASFSDILIQLLQLSIIKFN